MYYKGPFQKMGVLGVSFFLLSILVLSTVHTGISSGSGTRANNPPNAVITSPDPSKNYPDNIGILFDASNSNDPDGDPLTFMWTLMMFPPQPGPGMFPIIRNTAVFTETLDIGNWMVTLDVNDSIESSAAMIMITVIKNNPPVSKITSPKAGETYTTDDLIAFDATESGDADGDALTYHWESSLEGNLSDTDTFSSNLMEGTHTITLVVEDVYGTPDTTEVEINVRIPNYPPNIFLTAPDSSNPRASDEFTITWTANDANVNDMLSIDLYYGTEMDVSSVRSIASALPDVESYLWDVSGLENGDYYVYGVVTDEKGAEGTSWSGGYLRVHRNYPPTAVSEFSVADDHDLTPTLDWDDCEDPNGDSVSYVVTIGTSKGGKEISGPDTATTSRYSVPVKLEYNRTYHAGITTRDSWDMLSDTYETTFSLVNLPPFAPEMIIEPAQPTTATPLTCTMRTEAVDPENDPLSYTYRWFRKASGGYFEEIDDITENTIPASRLKVGDTWRCDVRASDGHAASQSATSSVIIINTKPEAVISSASAPTGLFSTANRMVECSAEGSSDDDGDDLTYLWESDRDGEIGTEKSVTGRLSPGIHQIKLTVSDGRESGTARITVIVESESITIGELHINPSSPTTGESVVAYAVLTNGGGDSENCQVEFLVNGEISGRYYIELFPSGSKHESRKFVHYCSEPGDLVLAIRVGEVVSESTVTVEAGAHDPSQEDTSTGDGDSGDSGRNIESFVSGRPWIWVVVVSLIGVVIIFGTLIYKEKKLKARKRKRRADPVPGRVERDSVAFPPNPFDPFGRYNAHLQTYFPPVPFFDGRVFEAARLLPQPVFSPPVEVLDTAAGEKDEHSPKFGEGSPTKKGPKKFRPKGSPSSRRERSLDRIGERITIDMEDTGPEPYAEPIPAGSGMTQAAVEILGAEEMMVECYKCRGDIPVTSKERPIVVTCPNCGTEGELN